MACPEPDENPAAGQPDAVQAAFAQLRAQFLAGLPQRWADIASAPTDTARQAALHRLAGAAGSYGLTTLGDAARQAERALGGADAGATLKALERLIRADAVTVR